jgi:hypothetical protein
MQELHPIGVTAGGHDHIGPSTGAKGSGGFVGISKKILCQVSKFAIVLLAKRLEVPYIRLVWDLII